MATEVPTKLKIVVGRRGVRVLSTENWQPAIDQAARYLAYEGADRLAGALKNPRNWKIGPPEGRRRFPVRSGLRFRAERHGRTVAVTNPAPYAESVERRFGRIARTWDRLKKRLPAAAFVRPLERNL